MLRTSSTSHQHIDYFSHDSSPNLSELDDISVDHLQDQEYSGYPDISEYNTHNYTRSHYSPQQQQQQQTEYSEITHSFDVGVIDDCLRNASILEHAMNDIDDGRNIVDLSREDNEEDEEGDQQILDSRDLAELERSLERDEISLSDGVDEAEHSEVGLFYQTPQNNPLFRSSFNGPGGNKESVGEYENEVVLDANEADQLDQEIDHDIQSEAFTLKEMLKDAMQELEKTRLENQSLNAQSMEQKQEIDSLKMSMAEMEDIHSETLRQNNAYHQTTINSLETKLQTTTSELNHLRSTQQQVSSIRQSIQEEKDLDILNLRVELMSEKEAQLRDLKNLMDREKEATSRQLRDEIQFLTSEFQREREEFRQKLDETKQEKEDECGRLEKRIQTLKSGFEKDRSVIVAELNQMHQINEQLKNEQARKPQSVSVGQQSDPDLEAAGIKNAVFELAQVFGLSPQTHILDVKNTIISYLNDLELRLDEFTRNLSIKEEEIKEQSRIISEITKRNEEWEVNHATTLQSLQSAHDNSIASLKQSYDHQIKDLSTKITVLVDPTCVKSWKDLESRFPQPFEEFRLETQRMFELDNAELFRRVKESVEQEKLGLKAFFEKSIQLERESLGRQYHQDVYAATVEIKEKCKIAYEDAVKKLKSEYVKLEQQCRIKFELNSSDEENMRTIIKNQEAYIASLEANHGEELEKLKLNYELLIARTKDEARIQYTATLKNSLEKMKQKYVEALRDGKGKRNKP